MSLLIHPKPKIDPRAFFMLEACEEKISSRVTPNSRLLVACYWRELYDHDDNDCVCQRNQGWCFISQWGRLSTMEMLAETNKKTLAKGRAVLQAWERQRERRTT